MPNSDVSNSGQIKTVATVRICAPPSTTEQLTTPENPIMGSGGVGSGYTSQGSTPELSAFDKDEPITLSTERRRLWSRPRRRVLRQFKRPIPQSTQDRFSDLREQYAESLNEFTRSLPNCQGIVMSLVVLGEEESTAEPWVFIQCDKVIVKKVDNFFKDSFVKVDFEPPNPTKISPRLRVKVHALPPRSLATEITLSSSLKEFSIDDRIEVYGGKSLVYSESMCSRQVTVDLYGSQIATIGGIIQLTDKDGQERLFGVTAGHFLAKLAGSESEHEVDPGPDDQFGEDEHELDPEPFEPEIIPGRDQSFERAETSSKSLELLGSWSKIGHVTEFSHNGLQDGQNLDWALISIDNQHVDLPNIKFFGEVTGFGPCNFAGKDKAVILATNRGPIWGSLSPSWSYSMLPPGNLLVRTYALTLEDNAALQSGDSGAWVVDYETMVVYGHVVASDIFGRAYVIPICDLFEDIKDRLSAQGISLPLEVNTTTSTEHSQTRNNSQKMEDEFRDFTLVRGSDPPLFSSTKVRSVIFESSPNIGSTTPTPNSPCRPWCPFFQERQSDDGTSTAPCDFCTPDHEDIAIFAPGLWIQQHTELSAAASPE